MDIAIDAALAVSDLFSIPEGVLEYLAEPTVGGYGAAVAALNAAQAGSPLTRRAIWAAIVAAKYAAAGSPSACRFAAAAARESARRALELAHPAAREGAAVARSLREAIVAEGESLHPCQCGEWVSNIEKRWQYCHDGPRGDLREYARWVHLSNAAKAAFWAANGGAEYGVSAEAAECMRAISGEVPEMAADAERAALLFEQAAADVQRMLPPKVQS